MKPKTLGALPETMIMDYHKQAIAPVVKAMKAAFKKNFNPWLKSEMGVSFDETGFDRFKKNLENFERDFYKSLAPPGMLEAEKGTIKALIAHLLAAGKTIAKRIMGFQRSKFISLHPRLNGVSPITTKALKELSNSWVFENVSLIKSIAESEKTKLGTILIDAFQTGRLIDSRPSGVKGWKREGQSDLVTELMNRFNVTEAKARLIARDQSNKFFSRLNQHRMKSVKLDFYIWRVSGDINTRPDHKAKNGKRFHLNHPPRVASDGGHKHPGEDYQCQCHMEPDFKSWEAELELEDFSMQTDRSLKLKTKKVA